MFKDFYSWTRSHLLGFVAHVVLCSPGVLSQLTGRGLSVVLNEVDYFISPFIAGHVINGSSSLSAVNSIYGFAPVTVVQNTTDLTQLTELLSNWTASDDVFQDGFTGAVLQGGAAGESDQLRESLVNTTTCTFDSSVPPGPYFLEKSTGALHQAYRLYDDFAGSFTTPLIQTPEGRFQPLSAQVAASASMTVGVPSRLYFTKTADKPLAGVRIGVKVRSNHPHLTQEDIWTSQSTNAD